MTPRPDEVAEIARRLTRARQDLLSGRYDADFASHSDAAALERADLWVALPPDSEDEFWRFEVTPLGIAVRDHLLSEGQNNG